MGVQAAITDKLVEGRKREAIEWLRKLTPERRLEVFAEFCTHCGDEDPSCQCWNDE